MDDDDEVLVVLAETLSTMLDYAGGPQHAEHVLRPLEKLCTIEETVVREKVSIEWHWICIGYWKYKESICANQD